MSLRDTESVEVDDELLVPFTLEIASHYSKSLSLHRPRANPDIPFLLPLNDAFMLCTSLDLSLKTPQSFVRGLSLYASLR